MPSPRPRVALATAAVLSAGVLAGAPSGASGAPVAGPSPRFAGGLAQPVYAAAPAQWIRQSLWVTARTDSDGDGRRDRVHIRVTRPRETRTQGLRVPVVYEVSPYYAGLRSPRMHDVDVPLFVPAPRRPVATDADPRTWVPRGFAVVHADSLGTGSSTGCPTSGGRNETLGAKAVVDWLNGRAVARDRAGGVVRAGWSTGKVGMIGTSYNGTLPNAVATTGVEGLEAIVSVSAISSWYDYYRAGGAVVAPGGFQGEDTDVLARAVLTRANPAACRPVLRRLTRRQDRRTGDYGRFWAQRNYLDDAGVRAAVLVAHGLQDWNVKTKHAAQWYAALRRAGVAHKLYLHQGGHGGLPPTGLLNRWFTHYLLGVDNGVQRAPHAYVRRPGGRLVGYREWPGPGAEPVDLRLRPRRAAARGRLVLGRPGRPVVERVVDTPRLTAARLARAPRSRHGRVYVTAPLRAAVRLSGTPVARLRLSFGQRSANVSVAVVDYGRDGRVRRVVTRGWRDPQNRGSLAVTRRVRPGRVYGLRVGLQPNDHVFARGHRIGLLVMSTDAQFTLRPPAGSTLALRTHRTTLRLPVVGGLPTVRRASARLN